VQPSTKPARYVPHELQRWHVGTLCVNLRCQWHTCKCLHKRGSHPCGLERDISRSLRRTPGESGCVSVPADCCCFAAWLLAAALLRCGDVSGDDCCPRDTAPGGCARRFRAGDEEAGEAAPRRRPGEPTARPRAGVFARPTGREPRSLPFCSSPTTSSPTCCADTSPAGAKSAKAEPLGRPPIPMEAPADPTVAVPGGRPDPVAPEPLPAPSAARAAAPALERAREPPAPLGVATPASGRPARSQVAALASVLSSRRAFSSSSPFGCVRGAFSRMMRSSRI
jgi:hypothetical protein